MKIPVHVTLDKKNMNQVDAMVCEGKFRSRSHAIDEAVKLLILKQMEVKQF